MGVSVQGWGEAARRGETARSATHRRTALPGSIIRITDPRGLEIAFELGRRHVPSLLEGSAGRAPARPPDQGHPAHIQRPISDTMRRSSSRSMTHPASRARERCTALGLRRKLRNALHRPAITRRKLSLLFWPLVRLAPLRSLPSPRQRVRRAIIYPVALTDTFYASPADLADHRPGDVLAARPVSAPAGFLNDGSAAEVPVDEFRGSPDCGGDHNSFTSRRRAGSAFVVVSPASSMLWGSAVRRRPRCTPTIFKLAIREAPGLNVAIAKGWSVAIPTISARPALTGRPSSADRSPSTASAPLGDSTRSASARVPSGWPATPAAEWRRRWPRRSPRPTP